jgi:lauroyl/myristoyl acyltransferase
VHKPLLLRFFIWAGSFLGRERLEAALGGAYHLVLSRGGMRRQLLSVQARVSRHVDGREPDAAAQDAFLARVAERYADLLASLYTLDREAAAGFPLVDTPALAEIERLRRAGRGVILASPHFGNVPLAIGALARCVPLTVLLVNGGPYKWCEAYGFRVTSLGSSAVDCVRALNANEAVLLFSDLDFFPEGRTADLFGAPVRPPHGIARLAVATGSPILPIAAVFARGRHRVEAGPAIEPAGRSAEELEALLLRAMEQALAGHLDHWLVLRDIWDVERSDHMNKQQLDAVATYRALFGPR